MWGLHAADWAVVLAYLLFLLVVGWRSSRQIKTSGDLYQGGRSLGKLLSSVLSFGSITDSNQATSAAREVYNRGLQGVWFSNHVLFHTPFQWFLGALQRRARYVAPGDLFLHRFESRVLPGCLAVFSLILIFVGGGLGFQITGKTMEAMLRKPPEAYTALEKEKVAKFDRMVALQRQEAYQSLPAPEKEELGKLRELNRKGEISSFASYLNLPVFYLSFATVVALYTVFGGLIAIAIMDLLQAVLILFLSFSLIPLGLRAVGGFPGLHARLPESMFNLFGGHIDSEYPWYYVAAFTALVMATNSPKSFTWGGAARDDAAAQVGFVTGSLAKRFVMIGWALAGLIGAAMYSSRGLSDPTNVWGFMTQDLLGPGLVGLMLVSIVCANLDGAAGGASDTSALVTKNLILPFRPRMSERKQLWLARFFICVAVFGGIPSALYAGNVVELFTRIISCLTITGPLFWVAFYWRRLTKAAIATQMLLSICVTVLLPWTLPKLQAVRESPALQATTRERVEVVKEKALEEDVQAGKAKAVGETIEKRHVARSVRIYFTESGDFRVHVWLMSRLGIDFESMTGPQVKTAGFLFDLTFPFLVLFSVSLFTKRSSEKAVRRFYACVHTPCVADPEEDARNVQRAVDDPRIVERDKLFPGTDWEFGKWSRRDAKAFSLCCLGVGVVIVCYMLVVRIGA